MFTSKKKNIDEPRTSAVVTDDTDLQITLLGGKTYVVSSTIFFKSTAGTDKDLSFQWAYTGSADVRMSSVSEKLRTSATGAATAGSGFFNAAFPSTVFTTDAGASLTTTERLALRTSGIIETSTGGTFSFKWAPDSAGGQITVYANSFLEVREKDGAASGTSGFSGLSGFSGTFSGFSGHTGQSGSSGFSGSIGDIAEFDTAIKPVNTSRITTTVLTNDPDLQVTLDPNTTYIVDSTIVATEDASNPDMKFAFDFDGTTDIVRLTTEIIYSGTLVNSAFYNSFPASTAYVSLNVTGTLIRTTGTIRTTGSGGTLVFKWAQFSSDTDATNVLQGSYLQVRKYEGAASGTSGESGTSGFSGTYSGFSGASGISGFSGEIVGVSKYFTVIKPSSTDRTTTALSDDPDLTASLSGSKTYYIDAILPFTTGSSVPGLKLIFAYTGTISNFIMSYSNAENGETDTQVNFVVPTIFALDDTAVNVIRATGFFVTSTGGTLSLQWAQFTLSGTPVTLAEDAYISVREGDDVASGYSGTSGASGKSGTSGWSGTSGQSGLSGTSGQQGLQGFSGVSGESGTSGYSGAFSGMSGVSGASGTSGYSGNGGSLDDAYDFGGPGGGRKINTDAGAVGFSGFSSSNAIEVLGHVKFLKDNASDIGAAGDERPKTVYAATSVVVGDTVTIESDRISSEVMTVGLGSGFSGALPGAVEGDLSYDHNAQKLRLQASGTSIVIGGAIEYLTGWVTHSNSKVSLGRLPANSVTTGITVIVTQGFSSFSGFSSFIYDGGFSGYSGYSGINSYTGYSGLVIGDLSNSDYYSLEEPVYAVGPKSVVLGSGFGYVDTETEVFAQYSGFSGYSGLDGKASVVLMYARTAPEP